MVVGVVRRRPWTVHMRRPEGARRSRFAIALLLAVVLHGLGLLLLAQREWRTGQPDLAPLRIELVVPPPRALLPPLPRALPDPPATAAPAVPRTHVAPTALARSPRPIEAPAAAAEGPPVHGAPPVRTPQPAQQVQLSPRVAVYGRDGRLKVPASVLEAPAAPVASWIDAPRTPAPWDQRIDPLVYTPTALEPLWKPDGETLLQEFIRHNTKTKTFKLPDGTRVTCGWVLILGGCAW